MVADQALVTLPRYSLARKVPRVSKTRTFRELQLRWLGRESLRRKLKMSTKGIIQRSKFWRRMLVANLLTIWVKLSMLFFDKVCRTLLIGRRLRAARIRELVCRGTARQQRCSPAAAVGSKHALNKTSFRRRIEVVWVRLRRCWPTKRQSKYKISRRRNLTRRLSPTDWKSLPKSRKQLSRSSTKINQLRRSTTLNLNKSCPRLLVRRLSQARHWVSAIFHSVATRRNCLRFHRRKWRVGQWIITNRNIKMSLILSLRMCTTWGLNSGRSHNLARMRTQRITSRLCRLKLRKTASRSWRLKLRTGFRQRNTRCEYI